MVYLKDNAVLQAAENAREHDQQIPQLVALSPEFGWAFGLTFGLERQNLAREHLVTKHLPTRN